MRRCFEEGNSIQAALWSACADPQHHWVQLFGNRQLPRFQFQCRLVRTRSAEEEGRGLRDTGQVEVTNDTCHQRSATSEQVTEQQRHSGHSR